MKYKGERMEKVFIFLLGFQIAAFAGIKDNTKPGSIVIVKNGEPAAVIVLPAEAREKYPKALEAANEIQKYIKKISGAELQIFYEDEKIPQELTHLYTGYSRAAKKNKIKIPSGFDPSIIPDVYEEGYIIKTSGNNIFIAGNEDGPYQGTIYAAYAFLEKLGCRWFFPGEWEEIIPETKTVIALDI